MTDPAPRRRTDAEAVDLLLDLVEADNEFNDDEDSPALGWASFHVAQDNGGAQVLTVTHTSAEEDDDERVTTQGRWILVPMGTTETPGKPS